MTGAGILVLLLFGFVLFATAATRKASQQIAQADGIVVLTGGKLRIDEGMQLLRDGRGRRLLITGVNPRTTRNDVKRIANPGAELFDCCVDFGYMAQDTIGNADETRDWVKRNHYGSLIVVTSSYHMPRSLSELGRALPGVELIPHPVVPPSLSGKAWWLDQSTIRMLASEYLKLLPSAARYMAVTAMRHLTSNGPPHAVSVSL
ncbi:MAG: YdcF family protein [Hyphomicrobiaceae bacterium]